MKQIFEKSLEILAFYKPDALAIEAQFFGKNVQSMLKLGRAQGVTIAAALYRSVPIFEYAPKKIKQSICGNGNASKEQIAGMLKQILHFNTPSPPSLDATDAVAVALCHYYQSNTPQVSGNYSGWKNFLKNNPDRMV